MYDEDVVCFFVNKLTPSLMTQESILGHFHVPNRAQKLCASSTWNEAQIWVFGFLCARNEAQKLCASSASKWGTKVRHIWGTKEGAEIKLEI